MVVSWTKWERRIGKEGGNKYRDMIFYIINLYIHKGSHIKCVYVYIYIYVDIFVWVITYADMFIVFLFVVFLCFSLFYIMDLVVCVHLHSTICFSIYIYICLSIFAYFSDACFCIVCSVIFGISFATFVVWEERKFK